MATRLNVDQRKLIADKLMDFGNLGGAATAIGQFVNPTQLNVWILLFGLSFVLLCYTASLALIRGGENK